MAMLDPRQMQRAFDLQQGDSGHTYINAAGRSPLLRESYDAACDAAAMKLRPWAFGDADQDRARELFAKFCSARPDQIAVTPNCSYAISIAALNVRVDAEQEIVCLEEHMANVIPWQAKARETGAKLVVCLREPRTNPTQTILDNINERTAVVAAAPCGWTDGVLINLHAISRKCKQVGAALVLDATQCIGALPFDVHSIGADFVACSVHKWLLGLYSFAFLYVADKYVPSGKVLDHHDRNKVGSDDWDDEGFVTSSGFPTEFTAGATRFDMGGRPNVVLFPPLIKGMEQVLAWGVDRIQHTVATLTNRAAARAKELGFTLPPGGHVGHILGIRPSEGMPSTDTIVAALKTDFHVHVAARWGSIRISPYVYNTMEDIDLLMESIHTILERHRRRINIRSKL